MTTKTSGRMKKTRKTSIIGPAWSQLTHDCERDCMCWGLAFVLKDAVRVHATRTRSFSSGQDQAAMNSFHLRTM